MLSGIVKIPYSNIKYDIYSKDCDQKYGEKNEEGEKIKQKGERKIMREYRYY